MTLLDGMFCFLAVQVQTLGSDLVVHLPSIPADLIISLPVLHSDQLNKLGQPLGISLFVPHVLQSVGGFFLALGLSPLTWLGLLSVTTPASSEVPTTSATSSSASASSSSMVEGRLVLRIRWRRLQCITVDTL